MDISVNIKKFIGRYFKRVIFTIVLVIFVFILLAACFYTITLDDGIWDEKENGNPSNYTQNVQISSSEGTAELTVDKDSIVKQSLINLGYTEEEIANFTEEEIFEKLEFNKKLDDINTLEDCTSAEVLWCTSDVYSKYLDSPEELEKLLNSEIITQYPKIGQDDSILDGIIEFERNKADGTSTTLTYMDKATLDNYINSNSITTSDGNSILNYFSLDDAGNVVVAVIDKETYKLESNDDSISIEALINEDIDVSNLTEDNKKEDGTYYNEVYNVKSISINYKSAVQNYTMPFQYLWALLVVGGDKDFVLELADLVEDSEIIISLYDNMTTTEYDDVYTYKKQTRTEKMAKIKVDNDYGATGYATERYWTTEDSPDSQYYNSRYQPTYTTDENEYKVNITKIYETNNFEYYLTKADVWIVNYSKEYEYLSGNPQTEENSKTLDDTEYILNTETSRDSSTDSSLLRDADALSFAASVQTYIERYATGNRSSSSTNRSNTKHTNSNVTNTNVLRENTTNSSTVSTNSPNTSGGNSNSVSNSAISENTTDEAIEVNVSVLYVKYRNYDHKIERKLNSTVLTTTQKYVEGDVVNEPKVDKNPDEDNPNFVSILSKYSHKNAKYQITVEIKSWLMKILEGNSDTKKMVDLTKYLINKVLGEDKYKVDEDNIFSEYENISFENISSIGSGDILGDFLSSWESGTVWNYINGNGSYNSYVAKYVTEDKKQYICFADDKEKQTRNYGYGVCHTANGGSTYMHINEYKQNGIDITSGEYDQLGVSKIDVSIVDNVKQMLLNSMKNSIKKDLAKNGITDLTENQLNALTAVKYQYGNIGNFTEMYKKYGNTEELRNNAKAYGATYAYYFVEVKPGGDYARKRGTANWKAFHEGIYETPTGRKLDSESYSSNGDFLEVAKKLWNEVCTSGKYSLYGGASIPVKGPTIDCSSFVSWCLYEYGYSEFAPYQKTSKVFYQTNWKSKYGWEEISVESRENPINKLKPGDIFVRYGNGTHHVTIVAEIKDGKLYSYDCGNVNANWNGTSGAAVNKTYFLTANGQGKIIRVKSKNN